MSPLTAASGTAGAAGTAAALGRKTLHLMRHGQTEMNEFLHAHPGGCADPMMFDTVLSLLGRQQAAAAAPVAASLSPVPMLLVASPLTRWGSVS